MISVASHASHRYCDVLPEDVEEALLRPEPEVTLTRVRLKPAALALLLGHEYPIELVEGVADSVNVQFAWSSLLFAGNSAAYAFSGSSYTKKAPRRA